LLLRASDREEQKWSGGKKPQPASSIHTMMLPQTSPVGVV
jgi:hypothetical protein